MDKKINTAKLIWYMFGTALVIDLYITLVSLFLDRQLPENYVKTMIAFAVIFGPSIGYCIYRIRMNAYKIKTDMTFRLKIIIGTTIETSILFYILWTFSKLVGLM